MALRTIDSTKASELVFGFGTIDRFEPEELDGGMGVLPFDWYQ